MEKHGEQVEILMIAYDFKHFPDISTLSSNLTNYFINYRTFSLIIMSSFLLSSFSKLVFEQG